MNLRRTLCGVRVVSEVVEPRSRRDPDSGAPTIFGYLSSLQTSRSPVHGLRFRRMLYGDGKLHSMDFIVRELKLKAKYQERFNVQVVTLQIVTRFSQQF